MTLDEFLSIGTPKPITYPCLEHLYIFPFCVVFITCLIIDRLTKLKILILVLVTTSPRGFDNPDLLVHYITCTTRALATHMHLLYTFWAWYHCLLKGAP